MACCTVNACLRQTAAVSAAPRRSAMGENCNSAACRNQPSQTLSAAPGHADPIHAGDLVPIAGAEQRQAMCEPMARLGVEGADTVFEQGGRGAGRFREPRSQFQLACRQRGRGQERQLLIQNGEIFGHFQVVGRDERQPYTVIRDARSHSLTGARQPPVLNIPLPRTGAPRRAECVRGQSAAGANTHERHDILQLIAPR